MQENQRPRHEDPALKNVSVLILTKNEVNDLPGCLESVRWSSDVHVLDSCSDDGTQAVAVSYGAQVTERPFSGYASQRNAGLALPFKNEWLLILDADERIPTPLAHEIQQWVQTAPEGVNAARIRRRDIWWGRWLKHAQISPYFVRLVRRGRVHYEREINEVLVVDGEIGQLSCMFDHFPFSKGLGHWIAKHNLYSQMEAELIAGHASQVAPKWSTALLGRDFNERRVHQKALFYRMPARPFIKLFYTVIVRRAVLDGLAGIRYAVLQSIYEYFIVLKTKEIEHRAKPGKSP